MSIRIEDLEFLTTKNSRKFSDCLTSDENAGSLFIVELCPRDPHEASKLLKKHTHKGKWNRDTGQREEKLDDDRFEKEFNRRYIKGWTGLTVGGFKTLAAVRFKGNPSDNTEVEFSYVYVDKLMKHSTDFSTWVLDTIRDVAAFSADEDDLDENFTSTPKQQPKKSEKA